MLIGLGILFIFGFALHLALLTHLRSRHAALWESLGKPTLFMNNSISNNISTQKFLWARSSLDISDPHLKRLILMSRVFTFIYGSWFVATVAVLFSTR
jgi:hypothetical protein